MLIGINGLKTSGKDTTYGFIEELACGNFKTAKRVAFADKLKIMAALALGYEGEPAELIALMDKFKNTGSIVSRYDQVSEGTGNIIPTGRDITGRQYLQMFGGKAREVFGDTFWIDQVLPPPADHNHPLEIPDDLALQERYPGVDYVCVTDVRYPNEAQRVLNLGGVVLEVVRPGLVSDGHDTEQPLPSELVTHTIFNDGTLTDLRWETDKFLEVYG